MEKLPLVSVIMPSYNSSAYIEEAIKSVQKQSYKHWELWVIDDFSEDHTKERVENLMILDQRIKLLSNNSNLGAGASRNKGIEAANGDYIAFLDSDDLWISKKLEVQIDFMQQHDLVFTFSSYKLIAETGEETGNMVEALPVLTYHKLLKSNYVGNLTGIYRADKLGKIYSPILRKRQDWALWLKILNKTGETKGINEVLAAYRIREDSISQNKFALLKYNFLIYYKFLDLGIFRSISSMIIFLKEHFFIKKNQIKPLNH